MGFVNSTTAKYLIVEGKLFPQFKHQAELIQQVVATKSTAVRLPRKGPRTGDLGAGDCAACSAPLPAPRRPICTARALRPSRKFSPKIGAFPKSRVRTTTMQHRFKPGSPVEPGQGQTRFGSNRFGLLPVRFGSSGSLTPSTITGGPPKHYTQPDFGAAWGPQSARGPLSRVFNVTMTSHCQCDLTISMKRVREKPS